MNNIYFKKAMSFLVQVTLLMGFSTASYAQPIAGAFVNSEIKNCQQISATEITFECWIANTATNGETQKLNAVTFCLNYNSAISTGSCTGSLVALGTGLSTFMQNSTNVVANVASGYMRYNSASESSTSGGTGSAGAVIIPTGAGIHFATFKITSTVPFTPSTPLNFLFQALNNGVRARHVVSIYRNTNTTANAYVLSAGTGSNGTGTGAYCSLSTNATCADFYNTPTVVSACQSYTWNNTIYTTSSTHTSAGTPQAAPCDAFNTYDILILTITNPGPQPTPQNCWDNFVFNTTTCAWNNTGSQPPMPALLCYQSATFNNSTCAWDISGTPGYNAPVQVLAAGSYNFCGTTYTTSGIYTCNTLTTNPCGYDIVDLTVASCTVAATATNVNVCAGYTLDLNDYVTPAGGTFNVPNPSIFPNGSTPYTYTVVDGNGCLGLASGTVNSAILQSVTGFTATGSTGTSISFSWNDVAGAAWYTIRYRLVGSAIWTGYSSINVPATSATIVGLIPATDYEFEIRANCNVSNQGAYGNFLTYSTTTPCPAPNNIVATPVVGSNGTNLLVSFTQNSTTGWNLIRARLASTSPAGAWTTIVAPAAATGTTLTGLTSGSLYEIQVQSKCSTIDASAWTIGSGTTGSNPSKGIEETVETHVSGVNIYPNPTRDVVNIEVTSVESASTVVKVFDISGRLVKQVQVNTEIGVNNLAVDLTDVSSGMYTIQVYEDNKFTSVTKLNKQD